METTSHIQALERESVMKQVRRARDRRGLPTTQIPLASADAVRSLLADGSLVEASETRPSKHDPKQIVTYRYLKEAS